MYEKNEILTKYIYTNYINSLCAILKLLGININTVPVLDILKEKTHKIIGSRSYSKNMKVIKKLAKICIKQYKQNKISTVIKHIPGHGGSKSDSHLKLPKINDTKKKLFKNDFKCFYKINSHFAMTAHILYSKIEKATNVPIYFKINAKHSKTREGILISDDISAHSAQRSSHKFFKNI